MDDLLVMNSELEKQLDEVYMSKESINAYLYAKDDPSLPKDHPKRTFMNRYNGYLNSDCFPKDSEMKYLYAVSYTHLTLPTIYSV